MIKIKNKKGQLGESIQDLAATIIVLLLLVLFFILSNTLWAGSNVEIKKLSIKQATINQEHISLQSWLQKPIVLDGHVGTITVSELIVLAKSNPSYLTALNEEAKKAFGENYEFKIVSEEDILKMKWRPYFVQGILMMLPESGFHGILFYLPSRGTEKTIFVNLIKEEKNE